MKAMILRRISEVETEPLELEDLPIPEPGRGEILIKVATCGVCHTELDEIEGRRKPKLPVVPGHEVIGRIERSSSSRFSAGERVGVAWIYSACGICDFCREGNENLCDGFVGTGCDADGGYAEYMKVPAEFAYSIPERFGDLEAAPLMCAGAVGYRALKLTGLKNGKTLGLFGFGASAHLVIQVVRYRYPRCRVFVFTRRRDDDPAKMAKAMGADWTGITGEEPPEKIDFAIDTTPVGLPVREALKTLNKGGRLVINAIRKETSVPELNYAEHLWEEKEIKSVANITRGDVEEFLALAAEVPIVSEIRRFQLEEANEALISLKHGKYRGAGVLNVAD